MKRLLHLGVKTGQWWLVNRVIERAFERDAARAWALPFAVLDQHLSAARREVPDLARWAARLPGGQGPLLMAILSEMDGRPALDALVEDRGQHIETRFEAMGWSLALRQRSLGGGDVPQRVMQFWDQDAPDEVARATAQWARVFGSRHQVFDDAKARSFLEMHHGSALARRFDALWHPAVKADLFRLAWLVAEGGVYVDADMVPRGALRVQETAAVSMTTVPSAVVQTGILAGVPNDPVWSGFLEDVLARMSADPQPINGLSGPAALTRFLYFAPALAERVALWPLGHARARMAAQIDAGYKDSARNWRVYEHQAGLSDAGFFEDLNQGLLNAKGQ